MSVYCALVTNSDVAIETTSLPDIQAAYIYNLMKFTIWPQSSFETRESIRVGLVGTDDITRVLKEQLTARKAQDKNIQVEYLPANTKTYLSSSGKPFHILYICKGAITKKEISSIVFQETLLVGSYTDFIKEGGAVSVIFDENKGRVVFYINLKALSDKTLSVSSKLLKIAMIEE